MQTTLDHIEQFVSTDLMNRDNVPTYDELNGQQRTEINIKAVIESLDQFDKWTDQDIERAKEFLHDALVWVEEV